MYQTFVNRCTLPAIPILHIRRIWAEVIHYCFFFLLRRLLAYCKLGDVKVYLHRLFVNCSALVTWVEQ